MHYASDDFVVCLSFVSIFLFLYMRSNCLWLENERPKLIYYFDCAFFDGVIAALIRFVAQCRHGHSGLLFHPIEYWVAHFRLCSTLNPLEIKRLCKVAQAYTNSPALVSLYRNRLSLSNKILNLIFNTAIVRSMRLRIVWTLRLK